MKVLFAMGKEQLSKKVAEKYYEKFGEELEYKNVFYFKALLEEVKNNKTYDRIVIGEELEEFVVKNVESLDKFIFNNIDNVTDEIEDSEIIVICSDRRTKQQDKFVERLFSIGVYNILIGDERNVESLCNYIKNPMNKKEAKRHLNINPVVTNSDLSTRDDEVEELQILNILKYYDGIKGKTDEYVKAFDRIAEQYSQNQLKVIASQLPADVKKELLNSEKYIFLTEFLLPQGSNAQNKGGAKQNNKNQKKGLFGILKENKKKENNASLAQDKEREAKRLKEEQQRKNSEDAALKVKAEQEAYAKQQAELKAKQKEIEEREAEIRAEQEAKSREQAELQARAEQEAKVREQAELQAKAEQEAKAREQAELQARAEQEAKVREQAELQARAEQEAKAREQAELQARAEQEAKAREQAELQARAQQEAAAQQKAKQDSYFEEERRKLEQEKIALEEERRKLREQSEKLIKQTANRPVPESNPKANINSEIYEQKKSDYKKMIIFVGANRSGTTFMVNAIAHNLADKKISVGVLDITKDKSMYYIYNQDDKALRNIAAECMQKLSEGIDQYILAEKNLKIYTSIPSGNVDARRTYKNRMIIDTIRNNNAAVLVDADFSTSMEYFEKADEIYVVQDLDIMKMQETTLFLRELKGKGINMDKIKVIINKYVKCMLTPKKLIEGLSYYNDPQMSFIDELISTRVQYYIVPLNLDNYARYIDGMLKNSIDYKKFTPDFLTSINEIALNVFKKGGTVPKKRGIFG